MIGCLCGLGDTSSWWRVVASADDVFLWRGRFAGNAPRAPQDALAILAAAMRAASAGLDARGVCVYATEGGGFTVDVVQTIRSFNIRDKLTGWSAEDIGAAVVADGSVRAAMPSLTFESGEWLELDGPASSKDFWLAHAVLWDSALGGDGGGPTQAFADMQGVYKGPADDGSNAPVWKPAASPLGPSNGNGGDGKDYSPMVWAAGIGLAVLGVYLLTSKEQRKP